MQCNQANKQPGVNLITDFVVTLCTLYTVANKPKNFSLERERIPVLTRLGVGVCVAIVVWFTGDPDTNNNAFELTLLQAGVLVFLAGSLALGAHLWLYRFHLSGFWFLRHNKALTT